MWLCSVGPRFHPSIVGPYSTLLITHVSEADKGNISCVGQEGKITISFEGTVRGHFYFTSKEHTVETPTLWWHDGNLNHKQKFQLSSQYIIVPYSTKKENPSFSTSNRCGPTNLRILLFIQRERFRSRSNGEAYF